MTKKAVVLVIVVSFFGSVLLARSFGSTLVKSAAKEVAAATNRVPTDIERSEREKTAYQQWVEVKRSSLDAHLRQQSPPADLKPIASYQETVLARLSRTPKQFQATARRSDPSVASEFQVKATDQPVANPGYYASLVRADAGSVFKNHSFGAKQAFEPFTASGITVMAPPPAQRNPSRFSFVSDTVFSTTCSFSHTCSSSAPTCNANYTCKHSPIPTCLNQVTICMLTCGNSATCDEYITCTNLNTCADKTLPTCDAALTCASYTCVNWGPTCDGPTCNQAETCSGFTCSAILTCEGIATCDFAQTCQYSIATCMGPTCIDMSSCRIDLPTCISYTCTGVTCDGVVTCRPVTCTYNYTCISEIICFPTQDFGITCFGPTCEHTCRTYDCPDVIDPIEMDIP